MKTRRRGGAEAPADPVLNNCVTTQVQVGHVDVGEKTGRYIPKAIGENQDSLLVGNTLYLIKPGAALVPADGCGENYVAGRLYRDNRYPGAPAGGRRRRRKTRRRLSVRRKY